jgi:hypothetical protein
MTIIYNETLSVSPQLFVQQILSCCWSLLMRTSIIIATKLLDISILALLLLQLWQLDHSSEINHALFSNNLRFSSTARTPFKPSTPHPRHTLFNGTTLQRWFRPRFKIYGNVAGTLEQDFASPIPSYQQVWSSWHTEPQNLRTFVTACSIADL